MDLGLRGRVAIVTASSKGLGYASARCLAREGASVVITGRRADVLEESASALEDLGGEVLAIQGDIAAPGEAERVVEATIGHFGKVDVLVANAGGPPPGRALEVSDADILTAVEANLLSSVRLVRCVLPSMVESAWGRICCISSVSVVQPIPTLALSNLARTGLRAWAKTAAADLAGSGVTLNLACPGLHATDRMIELGQTGDRLGDPDDFGAVVAFLCSAQAGFVNGAAVVVDGGGSLAL